MSNMPNMSLMSITPARAVTYHHVMVGGLKIFYRAAGPETAPVILLLHGFPSSSHMYRDLIPLLAGRYRVIAPDYPGYGHSDAPPVTQFTYTFERLADVMAGFTDALGLRRYSLYMQDFGGPVGFRLALRQPERITALVVQNAVAHQEGLSDALAPARAWWADPKPETEAPMRGFLTLEGTREQYLAGAADPARISPDSWLFDQMLMDRPGNAEIQMAMLYDYRNNPPDYPVWQAWLREIQPPLLVAWGRNDPYFTVAGARAYGRDVPKAEIHLLDGGHFLLEEQAPRVAALMLDFLPRALL